MSLNNVGRLWQTNQESGLKSEPRDRLKRIFEFINKDGKGLEIGPSYSPLAPKREKFNVHIVDHLPTTELIEKYREDELVDIGNIEEVDFIWKGESFEDLVEGNTYDWIIASHLIEHVPDPIGFLIQLCAILNDNGVISLAIPDYRYCFDSLRGPSSISEIISAHEERLTKHRASSVFEHYFTSCERNGVISWSKGMTGDLNLRYSLAESRLMFRQATLENSTYIDIHSWKFSPHHFALILHLIQDLYHVPLSIASIYQTLHNEFHVTLKKDTSLNHHSDSIHLELLMNARKDSQGF